MKKIFFFINIKTMQMCKLIKQVCQTGYLISSTKNAQLKKINKYQKLFFSSCVICDGFHLVYKQKIFIRSNLHLHIHLLQHAVYKYPTTFSDAHRSDYHQQIQQFQMNCYNYTSMVFWSLKNEQFSHPFRICSKNKKREGNK